MKPVRVTRHDDDLAVDSSRVVGFRGVSTAGWSGPVRVIRQDAVRDVQEYRAQLGNAARTGEVTYSTKRAGASSGV